MVNKIKKIVFFLSLLFLCFCNKKHNAPPAFSIDRKNTLTVENQLYNKINLFVDSSNCRKDKVIAVRYQKLDNKEFVQISAQNVFITDSLYALKEYNGHLLAVYNKEFFDYVIISNELERKKMIKKNDIFDFNKNNQTETSIPCFDLYEINNKRLIPVPKNTYYYNNLFADPPMLPPPPPPVK
ncbi:hypothetical protein GCM10023210_06250 [Chryseobacterium ginsengisoli]|uniref:Lipoprotein n=1 Tax=Chryseobacterium ginsengisoli TaxID=363853 RepID=A0ABP9LTV9_9FLAO